MVDASYFISLLFLNTYGLWWGIPDGERIELVFGNKKIVTQLSEIMRETREEIYKRTGNNPLTAAGDAKIDAFYDINKTVRVAGGEKEIVLKKIVTL